MKRHWNARRPRLFVLHKLGNVLNAALMLGEELEEWAAESPRLEQLEQTRFMLEEHKDNLVEFLSEHPRGKRIPEFLSALSERIEKEREDLKDDLIKMYELLTEMRELMLNHQDRINKME